MNRFSTLLLTAALAGGGAMQAQSLSAEAKQAYNAIKGNLTKMADKVPEDQYGFKPTPDIRSFGELVGHISESQTRTCSAVAGAPKQLSAKGKTAKADLVALLKESF
ncbi:MAG: DinB family protein, partial [Bryobacteraceae bacterium]